MAPGARLSARRAATPRCGRQTAGGLPTARSLSRGFPRVVRADGTGDREVPLLAPERLRRGRRSTRGSLTGSEIAYKCPSGLCAVRVADGKTRQIEYRSSEERQTSWSPDGSKIAFTCPGAVLAVSFPGRDEPGGVRRTAGTQALGLLRLVPDGTRLLLTGRTKVYSLDVDDGELRELVDMGGETNAVVRARGHRTVARY